MKKSKGYRSRTRNLMRKNSRTRGKVKPSKILREYQKGSSVIIKLDPSVQKGMPHKRFNGRTGTIIKRLRRNYIVNVSQGNTYKEIIVRSEHLEPKKSEVNV